MTKEQQEIKLHCPLRFEEEVVLKTNSNLLPTGYMLKAGSLAVLSRSLCLLMLQV